MALTKVTSGGLDGTFPDDSIVNADVNSSAAIALSKLATDPSNATNLASGTVPTARLGSGTASSSTVLYGAQTYKAEPGGGLNEVDQWRMTSSFDEGGTTDPLINNLERVDSTGQGKLGTGMSVSSGIWTFPSTGFWIVEAGVYAYGRGAVERGGVQIYATANDGTDWNLSAEAQNAMHANDYYGTGYCSTTMDVTDTSTHKIKFVLAANGGATGTNMQGSTSTNWTYFTFKRMGDT